MCNCKSYYTGSDAPTVSAPPPANKGCFKCNLMKSLQLGAIFFIIANPEMYKLTGGDVLLHSLVFALIILFLAMRNIV